MNTGYPVLQACLSLPPALQPFLLTHASHPISVLLSRKNTVSVGSEWHHQRNPRVAGQDRPAQGRRKLGPAPSPPPQDPRAWEFAEGNKVAEPSPSPCWASHVQPTHQPSTCPLCEAGRKKRWWTQPVSSPMLVPSPPPSASLCSPRSVCPCCLSVVYPVHIILS